MRAFNEQYGRAEKTFTMTVTPKPVTVTANAAEKFYGDPDPAAYTAVTTGTLGSDTVSYTVSRAEGENVGTYPITPAGETEQGNYTVNYVAGTFDYISRVAGMLLIGGKMDRIRQVATFVPAYLVNVPDRVVAKYSAANEVDAYGEEGDVKIYFNQARPQQQVCAR